MCTQISESGSVLPVEMLTAAQCGALKGVLQLLNEMRWTPDIR